MTKNEYIASIMLEAADLLKEDDEQESLNEGILNIFKKHQNRKNNNDIKQFQNNNHSDNFISKEEINKIPKNICGFVVDINKITKNGYEKILNEIELFKKNGSKRIKEEIINDVYNEIINIYKNEMGYEEKTYPIPLSKINKTYLINNINITLSIDKESIYGYFDFPQNITADLFWEFTIKNGLPTNIHIEGD